MSDTVDLNVHQIIATPNHTHFTQCQTIKPPLPFHNHSPLTKHPFIMIALVLLLFTLLLPSTLTLLPPAPPALPALPESSLTRYSRHLLLPTFGLENQKILSKSRVLVCGAGGLGSPLLQYLAAMGVGKLGVIDGDTVDLSNLQRQIIHGEGTVGVNKAVSAKKRIMEVRRRCVERK